MVIQNLPKIKSITAKSIAKNLLTTSGGKKVSDTKFKQLLKKDKNLTKYAYSGKNSTLVKHKAKKFFTAISKSATDNAGLKTNRTAAKKMGIKIGEDGEISNIGLNKIYKQASASDQSEVKPTGPTPDEIRREKRREKTITTMHKRDRASDITNERKQEQSSKKNEDKKSTATPPTRSGSSGSGSSISATNTQQKTSTNNITPLRTAKKTDEIIIPKLLIAPLNNRSANVRGMDYITQKINNQIKQTLLTLRIFDIISPEKLNDTLGKLGFNKFPELADQDTIGSIAKACNAHLFIFGHTKKTGNQLEIKAHIVNTISNQRLDMANVTDKSDDLFDIEKKINWQINNALRTGSNGESDDTPTDNQVEEIPI